MINRATLILKYRQPAVDWINNADPSGISQISLEFVNRESTVYLIEEEAAENLEEMLKANFRVFFENELRGWYTAEELWPEKLTYALFRKWFNAECHSVIEDFGVSELVDDDF